MWWTWVWASFGSWWWTVKPGVLQSMGLDTTEWLNWTELIINIKPISMKVQAVGMWGAKNTERQGHSNRKAIPGLIINQGRPSEDSVQEGKSVTYNKETNSMENSLQIMRRLLAHGSGIPIQIRWIQKRSKSCKSKKKKNLDWIRKWIISLATRACFLLFVLFLVLLLVF